MIKRELASKLEQLAKQFPVVAVLGPRQSGKTTLVQATFPHHKYFSFEDLDIRSFAQNDPRGFLETHHEKEGLILDEIQYVPSLLSYIQTEVDRFKKKGHFILTGSQNFLIDEAISQTLAGRIAILTLLPLSLSEMQGSHVGAPSLEEALFKGGYPRIYADHLSPIDWYPNYIRTYLERDVRQVKNVTDLLLFQRFLKLCAGRTGQLLNLSSLASDCGISPNTARSWISLLAASYLIFLLQPHHENFHKRLIKMPKLYFYDTGIACSLLGIERAEDLNMHFLRGGLFESFVISDLLKQRYHQGLQPRHFFWRDSLGHEIDCLIETSSQLIPMEIKSGKTISSDYFSELLRFSKLANLDPKNNILIYAGDEDQIRSQGRIYGWRSLPKTSIFS